MEEITYYLCKDSDNSNLFYEKLSSFTEEVEEDIYNICGEYAKDFMKFLSMNNIEYLRSESEYYLDILMMGVLWKSYINRALGLKKIPRDILIILSFLRKYGTLKHIVDFKRGIMETIFLNNQYFRVIELNIKNFKKLIYYLEATGEYKEEVKRLKLWEQYFIVKGDSITRKILSSSLDVEECFKYKAKKNLGCYTEKVNDFLYRAENKYKYREDYISCRKSELEYFFNMVGAEIMNKSYRELFLASKEKRLLLPACMRAKDENICKAIKTEEGYICSNCTKSCNVNKYDNLGKEYNFKVYIIPHESSISMTNKFQYGDIGIIGVACIINLISGGFKARNLDLIPQCVFLDYCGCKAHWHESGIITDINKDKLLHTLGINKI